MWVEELKTAANKFSDLEVNELESDAINIGFQMDVVCDLKRIWKAVLLILTTNNLELWFLCPTRNDFAISKRNFLLFFLLLLLLLSV